MWIWLEKLYLDFSEEYPEVVKIMYLNIEYVCKFGYFTEQVISYPRKSREINLYSTKIVHNIKTEMTKCQRNKTFDNNDFYYTF